MLITWRESWGASPLVRDVTWDQVRETFHAHAQLVFQPNADRKHKPLNLPLICFAAFEGSYKRTDLRSGLSAVCLDYDDTPQEDFARVLEFAREQNEHGIAHTTWKHGQGPLGTVRARLIVPFDSGELDLKYWNVVWAASLQSGYQADGIDRSCSNPERCYYVPATNLEAPWPCWIESW